MALTHKKISNVPDSSDVNIIQGSDWNADHSFNPPDDGIPVSEFIDGSYQINSISAANRFDFLRRSKDVKNITYEFANTGKVLVSTDYIFTPINGTLPLTANIVNTFIFTDGVPLGINSTNVGHYIRIVDAIGGNENVLITGGNALGGSPAGSITFTPTLSHIVGQYTIQTATAGISEALNSTAGGVSVFIPTGIHTIYATILINKPYTTLFGTGNGSTLSAGSGSVNIIKVYNLSPYWMYYCIHHLRFECEALRTNTVTSIHVLEVNQGYLHNLTFDNTHYGIYLNRINNCLIANIEAIDNTTCFFGTDSTTTNPNGQTITMGVMVVNFIHWNKFYAEPPGTERYTITEVFKLQGVAGMEFQNVRTYNLYSIAFCTMDGHCEGIVFDGGLIGGGTLAFQLRQLTTGPAIGSPIHISIRNMDLDLFWNKFIDIGPNCAYISILNCRITGMRETVDYVILAQSTSRAIEIRGCTFQNHKSGTVIIMGGGVQDFAITNNIFSNQISIGATQGNIIIGASCDNYYITDNIKLTDDTSFAYILINEPSGIKKYIERNLGYNDIHGTTTSTSTTMNLPYSYWNVLGGGVIQTINRPNMTGPLYLFVYPGATWSTGTSGNIAKASTAIPGTVMVLIWNTDTNKWHPSY